MNAHCSRFLQINSPIIRYDTIQYTTASDRALSKSTSTCTTMCIACIRQFYA